LKIKNLPDRVWLRELERRKALGEISPNPCLTRIDPPTSNSTILPHTESAAGLNHPLEGAPLVRAGWAEREFFLAAQPRRTAQDVGVHPRKTPALHTEDGMPHKSGWREAKKQGKSTSADGAARVRITLHGAPCFTSDDPLPVSTPSKPPLAPVPGASTPAGVIFLLQHPPVRRRRCLRQPRGYASSSGQRGRQGKMPRLLPCRRTLPV